MGKKVHVNQDVCISCGLCTALADAVFAFNDDGKADVILADIPEDLEASVDEAISSCPVQAIEED